MSALLKPLLILALVAFVAVYALATASTIPGPVFLTLLGGMMFGPVVGLLAQVGRRIEAEYQWRRVLTLDPDAKIKADVESKLASGQGPKGPAAAPRIAGQ